MKFTPQVIEREIDALATDSGRKVRSIDIWRAIRDAYDGADFATRTQLERLTVRLCAEGFGINLKETA